MEGTTHFHVLDELGVAESKLQSKVLFISTFFIYQFINIVDLELVTWKGLLEQQNKYLFSSEDRWITNTCEEITKLIVRRPTNIAITLPTLFILTSKMLSKWRRGVSNFLSGKFCCFREWVKSFATLSNLHFSENKLFHFFNCEIPYSVFRAWL